MCENGCFFEYKILLKTFTAFLRAQKYSKFCEFLKNLVFWHMVVRGRFYSCSKNKLVRAVKTP